MTGNAFLKRLKFQLDFLSPEDQKAVLSFYERKLIDADTLTEEEALVKSFGSPERIAQKLRDVFLGQTKKAEEENFSEESIETTNADQPTHENDSSLQNKIENTSLSDESKEGTQNVTEESSSLPFDSDVEVSLFEESIATDEVDQNASDLTKQNDLEEDLIFSKPAIPENTPEIVQSLENKEITPLYGEKVAIEQKTEPIEEIILEPLDRENGFTTQEIEMAKAETLEKAQKFDENTYSEPESNPDKTDLEVSDEESKTIEQAPTTPIQEIPASIYELDPQDKEEANETKKFTGLFKKMFASSSLSTGSITFFVVLLSVIVFPLLVLPFALGLICYIVLAAVILLLSLLVFILIAALVVGGIVELIYGFAMLFDTVSVALIEIGVGTVIFSIVTALTGLVYELLFGIMPRAIKLITKKFKRYMKVLFCYLYGGNA